MADECPKCEEGLPPWLATFADMMSLLLCFFVLLLSFAEIDAIRFKKMAESMKDAFGVQKEVVTIEMVKGTSVVLQHFSPAIPVMTLEEVVKQTTTDEKKELEVTEEVVEAVEKKIESEVEQQAIALREALKEEIEQQMVTVEREDTKIIIRIQEKGSFPSGRADLHPDFLEVMERISAEVAGMPGHILVAGHTDDRPISTVRFRSNWELSSARAVSVVHALLRNPEVKPERVSAEGHAETRPLVPNDTPENQAKNRRVELVLIRGQDEIADQIVSLKEDAAAPEQEGVPLEIPAEMPSEMSGEPAAETVLDTVDAGTPSPMDDRMEVTVDELKELVEPPPAADQGNATEGMTP